MKTFSLMLACAIATLSILTACNSDKAVTASQSSPLVAIIRPLEHPSLTACIEGFKSGLHAKLGSARFKEYSANGHMEDVPTLTSSAIADGAKLIFVVTTPAATASVKVTDGKVPLVYSAVTDPVSAGIVTSMQSSSTMATGVTDLYDVRAQVNLFHDILPSGKVFAILYNPAEQNSKILSQLTASNLAAMGLKPKLMTVSSAENIATVTTMALNNSDAVVVNGDNMITSHLNIVRNLCVGSRKPLFVGDPDSVKKGAVATVGPSYGGIGQLAGYKAAEVLSGKDVRMIPSENPRSFDYIVNTSAARDMGVTVPASVWSRRDLWTSTTASN